MAESKKCLLQIRNRSGHRLNLVIQATHVSKVFALSIHRKKRLRLEKGTYVLEAWLSEGRIRIKPSNIPHISIERITSRKDVNIRGRKIVADFINDRARLEVELERSGDDQ